MTTILTRDAWKASPFKRPPAPHQLTTAGQPVKSVVIHHSVTPAMPFAQVLRSIQRGHLTHNQYDYSDIAYNGAVAIHEPLAAECRGPLAQGGATGASVDRVTLSVCVVGDFETANRDSPTSNLEKNLEALLLRWIADGFVAPDFVLEPHSKYRATACPGARLAVELPRIQERIRLAARPAPPVGEWEGRARNAEATLEKIRRLL